MLKNYSDIETWFANVKESSHLHVSRIPFQDSAEWELKDGFIVHRSGRFFQVAGLRYQMENREQSQPIIVQQEVGVLGFIICDNKLLAYAKVEPGNVHAVQLAPTCQATASNLDRVHGGHFPFFGEWFTSQRSDYLHDSMQSEQGTRFYKKRNRNVLLASGSQFSHNEMYNWLDVDAVLELMKYDFQVNTDARSTLVCSPWEKLVNRKPFTRFASAFSSELETSLFTDGKQSLHLQALEKDIVTVDEQFSKPDLISLSELTDWNICDDGLRANDKNHFDVLQIKVQVQGRETSAWDQPIIFSNGEGYVELVCGRMNGVLYFLFVFQIEPGLYNIVELGPSLAVPPGSTIPEDSYATRPEAKVLLDCKQSDEGGRFFQAVSTYRLIDIGEVFSPPQHGYWLTLAQIRSLIVKGGWFTNEARSALSLLLIWL